MMMSEQDKFFKTTKSSLNPPIGLKPLYIAIEDRMTEVRAAIKRYEAGCYPVPETWVKELELLEQVLVQAKELHQASGDKLPNRFYLNSVIQVTDKDRLSYEEIIAMIDGNPQHVYSVTYAAGNNYSGILTRGKTVALQDGMSINAMITG